MKPHDRIVNTYVFDFKESVRGLSVGAPIDFRGIVIGEVTAIYTRYDRVKKGSAFRSKCTFIRSASRRATSRVQRAGGSRRILTR
jgi:paraquat-inducible protein B